MELVSLRDNSQEEVAQIWCGLEMELSPVPLSSKWDWVELWLQVYGDLVPHEFIYGIKDDKIYGACLVTKQTGRTLPFPVNCLQIGTAGEPIKDRVMMINNSLLVYPEYKQEFISLLIDKLLSQYHWEELRLDLFNKEDIDAFIQAVDNKQLKYTLEQQKSAAFDFYQAIQDKKPILEMLGKNTRYGIKKTIHGLGDKITTEYADTLDQALDIYQEMVILHQQNWSKRGKRGNFASERFKRFNYELIKKLFSTGRIMVFRVKSVSGTVGCLYGFIDNQTLYGYQCGFADFSNQKLTSINPKRFNPGLLTHLLCMQACLERDYKEYNFGPAEYQYKIQMSNILRDTWSLSVRKSIKPYVRDFIWNTYVKVDTNKFTRRLMQPLYTVYKELTS